MNSPVAHPASKALASGLVACFLAGVASGQVLGQTKLSALEGGAGDFTSGSGFGGALAPLGDVDGDGIEDVAAGSLGVATGEVFVLFLNADGSVRTRTRISNGVGGFPAALAPGDGFGRALGALGDVDGDGVEDLAVGAPMDDDGGLDRGAIWLLLLQSDGTVKSSRKVSSLVGGFSGTLTDRDNFGYALAALGDLDGDGLLELAVGARRDDDGSNDHGAVWILSLNADGTVASETKISATQGGFTPDAGPSESFGQALAALGDRNGDGVADLAVGAHRAGGVPKVWILHLNAAGGVDSQVGIPLPVEGTSPISLAPIGDYNGDGVEDLAVGDTETNGSRGGIWLLYLLPNGFARAFHAIGPDAGNFGGVVASGDRFGSAVVRVGDLQDDKAPELLVGARGADEGGIDRGAVWVVTACNPVRSWWELRNGSGVNPVTFHELEAAVLGKTWVTQVELSPGQTGSLLYISFGGPSHAGIVLDGLIRGEILIRAPLFLASSSAIGLHQVPVPVDNSVSGVTLWAQTVVLESDGFALQNAIEYTYGTH